MHDEVSSEDEDEGEKNRVRKWMHLRSEDMAGLDHATAQRVMQDYGRLVVHLAKRYHLPQRPHGPMSLDDMIASGRAVLMQCWVRFDPSRGAKFSTWAALNLRRTYAALVREAHGRTLTDQQNEHAGRERRHIPAPVSLEEPIGTIASEGDGGTIGDRIAMFATEHRGQPTAEDHVETARQRTWLREQMQHVLTEREREVVTAMFAGETGVEIGERLRITRQRVDQLWQRATEKLRWAAWDADLIDGPEPVGGPPAPAAAPAPLAARRARSMTASSVTMRQQPVVHDHEEAESA